MDIHAGMPFSEDERASLLSTTTVRRVWAMLTRTPNASLREVAERLGMPVSTVHYAVVRLEMAGYIAITPRTARARRVIVPFYVEELR